MNNEIQRKITSLTLMTIMLAGGMVIAAPGMEPVHAANANLFVSTQNFGGPMVVEINIIDEDYKETDQVQPMPRVTIDGKDLVMAQGSDGNWYAYIADKTMAAYADSQTLGLEFGTPFTSTSSYPISSIFDDSATVYFNTGTTTVVNNPQSLNDGVAIGGTGTFGQINIPNLTDWPLIQTFDFTDGSDIKVVYLTAGSPQSETIEYNEDMDVFATYSIDRTSYPHNADIHLLIDDNQLNIDPTDEDVWTFNVLNGTSYYGINSLDQINSTAQNALFYDHNGFLDVNAKSVIKFKDNQDSHTILKVGYDNSFYVTVKETLPNTGLFENTDSGHKANMFTTTDSLRGVSGIIEYNDENEDVLLKYFLGSVVMDKSSIDDSWSSGEPLVVNIIDEDQNINTKLDNDFDVTDSAISAIPAIEIGNPFTLASTSVVTMTGIADTSALQVQLDAANARQTIVGPWVVANQTAWDAIVLTHSATLTPLNANQTVWNGWVTANSTALASAFSNGAPQSVIDIIQDALNVAILGVSQLQTLIDGVYTATELITLSWLNIVTGEQTTLAAQITALNAAISGGSNTAVPVTYTIQPFSKILNISPGGTSLSSNPTVVITTTVDSSFLNEFVGEAGIHQFINFNVESMDVTKVTLEGATSGKITYNDDEGLEENVPVAGKFAGNLIITLETTLASGINQEKTYNVLLDVFTFGQSSTGDRYNHAIYRYEAEESEVNSGIYTGTVEYIMLNQINIFQSQTFSSLETIGDSLEIIVDEDLTDEDAVEVIYYDTDAQGINTQVSAKEDAPTHSAVISFDSTSYKVADTVTITLDDADLNTDSDTIDIYTVIDEDVIALKGIPESLLFDVTIDDALWETCTDSTTGETILGLSGSMSTFVETTKSSGLFTTTFQVPSVYCTSIDSAGVGTIESVTGKDLEVNYQDFRDASGETIETGDSVGIRSNTGSVSLDRTVYPVPWGVGLYSNFPLHATALGNENLPQGDLTIHVRVNDPDFDVSASGEDKIQTGTVGPIKITVSRGGSDLILATAGGVRADSTLTIPELGPIVEIDPTAGIFELDMTIKYNDGPYTSACPDPDTTIGCILQGDILQVVYNDPTDASGSENTVTDSATFDLRNGVLQSDKSVYIIGSDMILTLIEPDFDLDNDQAESYDLDLIEWDSDADQITMGNLGGQEGKFDPEPSSLRETGDSTGIFQIVIEIPKELDGDRLERGEEIQLEYTDWGPSGADYVGDEDEDINLTIYTSNFGATVELDQKVYTWTDKVYITIVAPDLNFDDNLIDEIGTTNDDSITVSTRTNDIDNYKLVETGTDTGIFTGEVILTGFSHDADGDRSTGNSEGYDTNPTTSGSGPTNGFLEAGDDDGLTVSFEFSDGDIALGSALIRWNIGEVQFLEASYPASGTGIIRVIDPDMNLDPEAVDNFSIDMWSDSDAGGIDLTVTETNEATGIFEGTVFFTATDQSSGHRLRVAEGDTVTAEYEDNTLPDPYTTADELDITATTLIGTVVPPLERAPAANLRTVDAFGNSLGTVQVDQQVQISADLSNGQDREQAFAYLVQIQDGNGVTVSLAWITGSLSNGQSFSPALSWIPTEAGTYTATAFVWESIDNPTALSPPVSTTISVS